MENLKPSNFTEFYENAKNKFIADTDPILSGNAIKPLFFGENSKEKIKEMNDLLIKFYKSLTSEKEIDLEKEYISLMNGIDNLVIDPLISNDVNEEFVEGLDVEQFELLLNIINTFYNTLKNVNHLGKAN